jgi:hypothetical protein
MALRDIDPYLRGLPSALYSIHCLTCSAVKLPPVTEESTAYLGCPFCGQSPARTREPVRLIDIGFDPGPDRHSRMVPNERLAAASRSSLDPQPRADPRRQRPVLEVKRDASLPLACTASPAPGCRRPVKAASREAGARHAPAFTGRRQSGPIAGSKHAFAVTALPAEPSVSSKGPLDATVVALKTADVPADVPLKHR